MKIALTGAHGTGKTTLTEKLLSVLSPSVRVKVCREVPRLIIDVVEDDEFFRRGNNSPLRQSIIFMYQLIEDHFSAKGADLLISDRTMVDHLAYTLTLFPDFENEEEFPPIFQGIERWMATYDLTFKLPIEFPVKDDGVREGDSEFQQTIDTKIDDLYERLGITPTVISGSVSERADAVLTALPSKMLKDKALENRT